MPRWTVDAPMGNCLRNMQYFCVQMNLVCPCGCGHVLTGGGLHLGACGTEYTMAYYGRHLKAFPPAKVWRRQDSGLKGYQSALLGSSARGR